MGEGTSATAGMPIATAQRVRATTPSIAGLSVLTIGLLLLGAGNVIASAVRVMGPDAPRSAPWSYAVLCVAGLAGFVVMLVQLAGIRRAAASPDRKLLMVPAAIVALSAACALLASTSASAADKTWVRLAVLGPGAAWASVLLAVAAAGLAFATLKRSRTRVFDERGVTALLLGIVLFLGAAYMVGSRWSDELVLWCLLPSAGAVVALAMLASSGPFDESASEEARRWAWWVIGLSLAAVGCAIATFWLLERSEGRMPGGPEEALSRSQAALSCAWMLLAPVGAAAACSCRLYARGLLLVLGIAWTALLVSVFPHMTPLVRDEEMIPALAENAAAVSALVAFALVGMLAVFSLPWWIHAQSRVPSWLIAAGAPLFAALSAVSLHANAALAKARNVETPRALQTELWRLQGFWWVGVAGVLLLGLAIAALGLRGSARAEGGRAGWRGVVALAGGFAAGIAVTFACVVWTSTWSGAHASVTLSLGPGAMGLVAIYLAGRNVAANDVETADLATADVLLITLASLAGIAMAIIASEARMDLQVLFASSERGRDEAMLTTLAPEVAPWLTTIPVVGAALVVMSAPGRWQAAQRKWKAIALAASAAAIAVACLYWLESSALDRVRTGGAKHRYSAVDAPEGGCLLSGGPGRRL
jgi:hypothetical protein